MRSVQLVALKHDVPVSAAAETEDFASKDNAESEPDEISEEELVRAGDYVNGLIKTCKGNAAELKKRMTSEWSSKGVVKL